MMDCKKALEATADANATKEVSLEQAVEWLRKKVRQRGRTQAANDDRGFRLLQRRPPALLSRASCRRLPRHPLLEPLRGVP